MLLLTPILLFRAKSRAGLPQKLGAVPADLQIDGQSIWFHAVSVGEFNAIRPLLEEFHRQNPGIKVVVSTTTATGQKLAKEKVGAWASVVYLPFDCIWALRPWLDRVNPSLFVIAETEIWPGLTDQCTSRSIPILIVNGRISPRSFKSYYRFRAFFRLVIEQFKCIGTQTEEEAERYRKILGTRRVPDQIQVLGNLKFDGLKPAAPEIVTSLRQQLNLPADAKVIVGGSTHEGEELALIQSFSKLQQTFPTLKLILVPRHPERFNEVAELIGKSGLSYARFSLNQSFAAGKDILLLDAIGHLLEFYSLASVAFVGGTIYPLGGHNLMEPYADKVPVVCGPHLEKIKDVANALTARQALTKVADAAELTVALNLLLSQPRLAEEMGSRGHQLIIESSGATSRALTLIDKILASSTASQRPGKKESALNRTSVEKSKTDKAPVKSGGL